MEPTPNKNLFQNWNEKSIHFSWTSSQTSGSVKVEEWLKEALEDDLTENFDENLINDDFDESSIEIIDN